MQIEFWNVITTASAAILVAIIGLLAWKGRDYLISRLSQEQLALLKQVVARAVLMAEQISQDNTEKKRLAMEMAEKWLKQYGIEIDLDILEAAVEAAVLMS